MPSHPLSYSVHTPNQAQSGKKWVQKVVKDKSKAGFATSIFTTYLLVAGIIGFVTFNSFQDQSHASTENAFVSASLRLIDEKDYQIGSKIQASLTIQNTSITEPINSLNIEFNSTENAVRWDSMVLKSNIIQPRELKPSGNIVTVPLLAAGERVEYTVSGVLTSDDFDFLTLVGRLTFNNVEGSQNSTTNRIFTKLKNSGNSGKLLTLDLEKNSFEQKEKINFNLSYTNNDGVIDPLAPKIKGKIYITQKDTANLVAGLDCELDNTAECQNTIEKLEPGIYTALFISDTEEYFSQIVQFQITGVSGTFIPSNLAILEFPFNSQSINGIVPVRATKVMSLNDKPSGQKCTFEILKEEKVISTISSVISQDRICATTLDSTQFTEGDGSYIVRLAGTSKSNSVLFTQKLANLIPLETETLVLKSGNSVQISASDIPSLNPDEDPATTDWLTTGKATLGIWHPQSGQYKEITNFGGSPIEVVDGQLNVNIPGNELDKNGFYSVYLKLEDGRYTEFLGLSFEDEKVGFSQSGVLVEDLNKLKVGEDIVFRLENVVDRSGNKITQAECALNLYQTGSGPIPISEKGEIKDGVCRITVPKDKITRSGPILVTFTGDNISNRINQSRQFYISSGSISKYGYLGLEYEPAKTGYANNIIIGPVTDTYGNDTNAIGYTVQVFDIPPVTNNVQDPESTENLETSQESSQAEPSLIAQYPVNIEEGFAKITAPSSLFTTGKIKLVLLDQDKKPIKEKEVVVQDSSNKLILPNFPKELNSDNNIQFGLTDLRPESVSECSLHYFKSETDLTENKVKINPDTKSCEFDWNLNQFRDNPKGLLQLQAGENIYTDITKNISGQASNLFITSPQLRINDRNEVEIELLTSPITDINNRPVSNGTLRWEYNNKNETTQISGGFASLSMTANKINSQDLRNVLDQKFLEISLDGRASLTSINKTRSISIYLGNKEIANTRENFDIKTATNQISFGDKMIFQFQTEACNVNILSSESAQKNVQTHWQGGNCYVEVGGSLGQHKLLFEENGFTIGKFDYSVGLHKTQVTWCNASPCSLQVITQNQGGIKATIFDEDKQYQFETNAIDNVIVLEQSGLNPLKNYLVEISFVDESENTIKIYQTIKGEYLQKPTIQNN